MLAKALKPKKKIDSSKMYDAIDKARTKYLGIPHIPEDKRGFKQRVKDGFINKQLAKHNLPHFKKKNKKYKADNDFMQNQTETLAYKRKKKGMSCKKHKKVMCKMCK